jgi:KAP family P-loop domain
MIETQNTGWEFPTLKDEPLDDAVLLGFGDRADALFQFIKSEDIITPLVIAIHGEWGSGKTSLLLTLKKKIDDYINNQIITIFFDAWKYESSDPAVGLFFAIASQLRPKNQYLSNKVKDVAMLAADIFSRRYIGMSIKEVKKHLTKSISSTENLSKKIDELVKESSKDKRIVVFIDDLDRCSLDNVLKILDALKLFLNLKNFVFIIAVDIAKIKLAWSYRYGGNQNKGNGGLDYFDKIIQIVTKISAPTLEQIKVYIQYLNPKIPTDFIELLSISKANNPRKIKQLLNLISLRKYFGSDKTQNLVIAVIWTTFEAILGVEGAAKFYNRLGGAKQFYEFLNRVNEIGSTMSNISDEELRSLIPKDVAMHSQYTEMLVDPKFLQFMKCSSKIIKEHIKNRSDTLNIIRNMVEFPTGI